MNPFEMVVLIVAIVMFASVLKGRTRRGRETPDVDPGAAHRLREEVRALKERVAVLERLVTDERGSRELDRQIEALRSRDA